MDRIATLRELRLNRGLYQAHVAKGMGITQPRVSQIEREPNPHLNTVARYISALGGELTVTVRFPDGSSIDVIPDRP